ncbi:6713_t:CDS:2, partial [Entrophospora sp. SA101]
DQVIDKIEKVEENINNRFELLNQDQVKEKIEEIEKSMKKLLNGVERHQFIPAAKRVKLDTLLIRPCMVGENEVVYMEGGCYVKGKNSLGKWLYWMPYLLALNEFL